MTNTSDSRTLFRTLVIVTLAACAIVGDFECTAGDPPFFPRASDAVGGAQAGQTLERVECCLEFRTAQQRHLERRAVQLTATSGGGR